MVVGLGVAVVPSAMAATAPAVTVTAPSQVGNGGTAQSGLKIKFDNSASGTVGLSGLTYTLTVEAPAGVACTNVTLTNTTTNTATPPVATADFLGTAASGTVSLNGTSGTCTASATPLTLAAGAEFTDTYTVSILQAGVTGTVTVTAALTSGLQDIASSSATFELVAPGGPTAATTVAQPQFGSVYSEQVITDPGFPPAPMNTGADNTTAPIGGYSAVGFDASKDAVAAPTAWSALTVPGDYVLRSAANAVKVTTGTAPNTVDHYYLSLNDAKFATGTPLTGFFLDTQSGNVVFGTLDDTGTANKFTSLAVNNRTVAAKYTWVIIANNNSGGAVGANQPSGLKNVTLLAHDVASPTFNLAAAFSDVSDSNVFADAINALATAKIIKGLPDGSFGATRDVTRAEFAAYAARTLQAYLDANTTVTVGGFSSTTAVPSGNCTTTNPSAFDDVQATSVFCADIKALAGLGVINGTTTTTFSPNADVTRDQIAAYLYRLNGAILGTQVADATPVDTSFPDVTADNILSGDVAWAADNGIVNGYTDGTFRPGDDALRQEAAAFIYRFGANLYGLF